MINHIQPLGKRFVFVFANMLSAAWYDVSIAIAVVFLETR